MTKQYAVLGLGLFGKSLALTLESMGHEVLAVDENAEKVQLIADEVTRAVQADASNEESFKKLGLNNMDGIFICFSENLESSIITAMLCKEMKVKYTVAKAQSPMHGKILEKMGVDRIVYPEKEMGKKVARSMNPQSFAEWINLSEDYSLVEMPVPEKWIGKTIQDLQLRQKCGINVTGIKQDDSFEINIDPVKPLEAHMTLVMVGKDESFDRIK